MSAPTIAGFSEAPANVRELLDRRLAERGLTIDDAARAGLELRHEPFPHGWVAAAPFHHADGTRVDHLLVLDRSKAERNWRWFKGADVSGAVLELGDAHRAELVVVVEGESDGLRAWRLLHDRPGVAVLILPSASIVPGDLANRIDNGARVVVATDADPAGDKAAEKCRRALISAGLAPGQVRRLRPEVPGIEKPDLRDLIDSLGDDRAATMARFEEAPAMIDPDPRLRPRASAPRGANGAVPAPVPAACELAPADLLDAVTTLLRRFVVMSDHQAAAVTLWIAHTHAADAADATPYLSITSAEKRSGKSRLLEILELVVADPLMTANCSTAALFRLIDDEGSTLLMDEVDTIFAKGQSDSGAEEMRGILNAGHRRGARAVRMTGTGAAMKARRFDVFGPKAFAGIGDKLPDTLVDRSIPIRLKRAAPGERRERYRRSRVEQEAADLAAGLAAWAESELDHLRGADPEIPEALNDRAADGWEPLLALADLAGGPWPARGRAAALALSGEAAEIEESLAVHLLRDVRDLFDAAPSNDLLAARGADRLSSAALSAGLVDLDESPWGGFRDPPFGVRTLAKMLKPYEIRPSTLRLPDNTQSKGYKREQFADAWARYCPPPGPESGSQPSHRHNPYGKRDLGDISSVPPIEPGTEQNGRDPAWGPGRDDGTAKTPPEGAGGEKTGVGDLSDWRDLLPSEEDGAR